MTESIYAKAVRLMDAARAEKAADVLPPWEDTADDPIQQAVSSNKSVAEKIDDLLSDY